MSLLLGIAAQDKGRRRWDVGVLILVWAVYYEFVIIIKVKSDPRRSIIVNILKFDSHLRVIFLFLDWFIVKRSFVLREFWFMQTIVTTQCICDGKNPANSGRGLTFRKHEITIIWRLDLRTANRIDVRVLTADVTYVASDNLFWLDLWHRTNHCIQFWWRLWVLFLEYHLHSFFELLVN